MYSHARLCLCACGIMLSAYAYYVEIKKAGNEDYEALCDVNDYISCSTVFTSEYGRGFGIIQHVFGHDHLLNQPNGIFGLMLFALQLTGIFWKGKTMSAFLFWTTGTAICGCIYLAYILAFVLHDFCVVCVSTYVVIVLLHYLNYKSIKQYNRNYKKEA
ncbi:vitamin K epoxide reductase complex subunit 1-like [Clavelina lepadiformis]|uniref:vitamin-K-epoxide reductase (warfarin-sensitive) n=1 Tax=Clavelina lepadiformis TaxID=159417 RepID=A0ABP0FF39_CLALP